MVDVRLIVIALAACGQAGAAPGSGIAAPAGWQAMPELAAAAKDAIANSVAVAGAEAWGEPAMGCYGLWLALATGGDPEAVAGHVVDGFASPALKIAVHDVTKPGADGVMTLAFEREPYRGRLRAHLAPERITALACFDNQREPRACDAACTTLLGALR